MTDISQEEIIRLKTLLERSSEFIAYFELAEKKMQQWLLNIERNHQQQLNECLQKSEQLKEQAIALNEMLSQTGIQQFRQSVHQALNQGEKQLQSLYSKGDAILKTIKTQFEYFEQYTNKSLQQIESSSLQAIEIFHTELSKYDATQFHRIADESCMHIQEFAQDAVKKNRKILKSFQWRFLLLVILTTLLTTFVVGLYVADELPWEMHKQAMSERQAGRLLLSAWQDLSQQERQKILHHESASS